MKRLLAIILLAVATQAHAAGFETKVVAVPAPGIVEVLAGGDAARYRLRIGAPPAGTPAGDAAVAELKALVFLKKVQVVPRENAAWPWNWFQSAYDADVYFPSGENVVHVLLERAGFSSERTRVQQSNQANRPPTLGGH